MSYYNKHFSPQREVINPNQNHIIRNFDNGFRINETLLGRIVASRIDAPIYDYTLKLQQVKLDRTIPRPIDFGNDIIGWFNSIRDEAKAVLNKIHDGEIQEKLYQKQLQKQKEEKFLEEKRKFYRENGMLPEISEKNVTEEKIISYSQKRKEKQNDRRFKLFRNRKRTARR